MNQLEFNTQLPAKDVDVYGLEEMIFGRDSNVSLDLDATYTKIYWTLTPDLRDYGVRGLDLSIQKVNATIVYSVHEDDLTQTEKDALIKLGGVVNTYNYQIEGKIELSDYAFVIKSKFGFDPSGYCEPSAAEIDFVKMTIEVD